MPAVCVLLLTGSAGCGTSGAHERGDASTAASASPSPVGSVAGSWENVGAVGAAGRVRGSPSRALK